ncbi:MAG: 20S proteasome alpha/beta subunit [Candidatus Nitrosomirales archaeon]
MKAGNRRDISEGEWRKNEVERSYDKYLKNRASQERERRSLTYILGARCKDGVVLVADRRFTIDDGTSYTFDNKLIGDLGGIIVGFPGGRGTFEIFRTKIRSYVRNYQNEHGGNGPHIDELINQTSDIMHDLYNKYRYQHNFDALVGISGASSSLRYFYYDGRHEPITTYKAIGSGAPYGSIYVKEFYRTEKTMEEVAAIGDFVIRLIEGLELDLTVGIADIHPDIIFIPDGLGTGGVLKDYSASREFLDKVYEKNRRRWELLLNQLHDLVK